MMFPIASGAALRFSFALRPPWLRPGLRRIVGGETMTTPVGRAHSPFSGRHTSSVLGPPASLIRSGLSLYGGSDPSLWLRFSFALASLCTGPMPQGVSYVHHEYASLYIRNIIPTGAATPRVRLTSFAGVYAGAIHPTSGNKDLGSSSKKFQKITHLRDVLLR